MKISLNCVVKNEGLFLIECIESVVSYADEVLIIDDNSIDNTAEMINKLINKYQKKIKLINKPESKMNLGELRELLRTESTGELIWRFDGDVILINQHLILNAINELKEKNMTAIAYSYLNLYGDFNHVSTKNSYENWIHKKNAYKYQLGNNHIDELVQINDHRVVYINDYPVVHLNNIKPIFNIYYRSFLTEYQKSKTDKNYINWLYEKKYGHESVITLIESIISSIKWLLNNMRSNDIIVSFDTNLLKNIISEDKINLFKIITDGNKIQYDQTIIMSYGDIKIYYPSNEWEESFKILLEQMVDSGDINKF